MYVWHDLPLVMSGIICLLLLYYLNVIVSGELSFPKSELAETLLNTVRTCDANSWEHCSTDIQDQIKYDTIRVVNEYSSNLLHDLAQEVLIEISTLIPRNHIIMDKINHMQTMLAFAQGDIGVH